ncbi:Trm112 family protein [Kocuria kalidii]|uniref:Trm112 family protein n=1 Tax=Kocuria kalidii TaxID=3376283 RepID=UPI0037A35E2F
MTVPATMTSPATTAVPATTRPTHGFRAEDRHASRSAPRHDVPAGGRTAPWALPGPGPAPVPPAAGAPAPRLLEILRCPLTGGTLIPVDADRLMSDRPFRDGVHPVYPIVRGIPCLTPVR